MAVTRTPKAGDRSAHNVTGFPALHASDLEANAPVHHVPAGSTTGDIPTWDGSKWTSAASGHTHSGLVTNGDSHDHAGGDGAPITDANLSTSDITTNDVSTSKHGFAPKAPNDATKFLDGAATYDTVKDSDLSTSDITTNDVSTSKHGFTPKLPNDATKYLDGTGAYTVPAGSGGGQYRQFTYEVSGGDFHFIIDEDGNPVMTLEDLE